jgi:hypothetical protein
LFSAYAAGCILPWALLALWKLASSPSSSASHSSPDRRWRGPLLGWALAYFLIVVFNLPCAVLTAHLVGFWALAEVVVNRRLRLAVLVAIGGALGALMAAAFLLPVALELASITPPLAGGEPAYKSNFLFQATGSWMAPGLLSVFTRMGAFQVVALAIALAALLWRWRRPAVDGVWLRLLATFALAALFLSTPLSTWLWKALPFLQRVNMPWRLLDHLAVPTAALAAAAVACLLKRKEPWSWPVRAAGVASLATVALLSLLLDISICRMNGRLETENGAALARVYYSRPGYFLPRGAMPPDELTDHPLVDVLTPGAAVEVREWSSGRRRLRVVSPGNARLGLRTYYFPGWTARFLKSDGRPRLSLRAGSRSGRIILEVPAGDHEVELSFENTPARNAAAAISVLALAAWALAALAMLPRRLRADPRTRSEAGAALSAGCATQDPEVCAAR